MSRKPFLTFVAISAVSALAALGVTACGSGSSDDATVVQAAATPQFLTESADRTATVESGRFELSIDVPASTEVPKRLLDHRVGCVRPRQPPVADHRST